MGVKSTGADSLKCFGLENNNNSNHPPIDSDHTQRINDRSRSAPPNPPSFLPPPAIQLPLPRQFEQYHHIMSRQDLQNNNVYENYIDNHLFLNPMHDNYQYPYFLTNTPVDEWSTTLSINNNNYNNNNNNSSYPTTPRSSTATFVDIPDSTLTIGTDMSLKLTPVSTPKLSPLAFKIVEQIKAKSSPKNDKKKIEKEKEKEKEKKKDKGISQSARIRAAGRQAGGRGGADDPLNGRTRRTTSTKKEIKKDSEEKELKEKLLKEQLIQEIEILK